ncbi:MAG: sigma-70 family RNA polymerase sigma factor [Gemmatales bacterium]|nr:sigma-70 family RNA polymerase sigma factor [Gemmatales bacterium]MDW8221646.1 sigma-70 family RNA polymerase sigma factor [Gemmatales bacterium]
MPAQDRSVDLVYHFARLQLPRVRLSCEAFRRHLERMYQVAVGKMPQLERKLYLERLYAVDALLAAACLEREESAWEYLFAARAGQGEQLLLDALRKRAARLFPRDEQRQESAVADFWGHLLVPEGAGSLPILARYDALRPLVPWLIRSFQNWHISRLRSPNERVETLPDDETLALPTDLIPSGPESLPWHEVFREAATDWLETLSEEELLLLGLLWRCRLSQRETAQLLGVHEGTVSRRLAQLRERCHDFLGRRLEQAGWLSDDFSHLLYHEMGQVLLESPRCSLHTLGRLLANRGLNVPQESAIP